MIKKDEYLVGFEEFEERCKRLAKIIKSNKNIKDIYGIMRSGMFIAIRLSYLTNLPITNNPKLNQTCIIENVQNSGTTRHSFAHFNNFFPFIDKQEENIKKWVVFWYEEKLK